MKAIAALLEAVFKIRPEEQKTVLLMFMYTMCAVAAPSVVGRTVSNTLFLKRVDKGYLPLTYVAVALAAVLVSLLMSKYAGLLRRDRVMKLIAVLVSGTILAFRWAIELAPNSLVVLGLLYLLVEVMGDLLLIQFWNFANDIFTSRSAKRLFGFIAGGGTVSFLMFAALVRSTVKTIGAPNLMFVMAALVLLLLIPIHILGRLHGTQLDEARKPARDNKSKGESNEGLRQDFAKVGKSGLLTTIAGIITLTTIVTACIDYQWKVSAQAMYADNENALGAYFGSFYLVTGFIQVFFSFVISGRILERLGVAVGLSMLPFSIFFLNFGVLMGSSKSALLWLTTAAKGSDNILRFTIHNTSLQILYLPVSSELRSKAKVIIDGMVKPFASGLTGLMILGLTYFFEEKHLSIASIIMVVAWLALAPVALKHYKLALSDSIRKKSIDTNEELILDEATLTSLASTLEQGHERDATNALEVIKSFPDHNWDSHVVGLLKSPFAGLRIGALYHLGRKDNLEYVNEIEELLVDEDPEVKAAAVEAYCALGEEQIIMNLEPFLKEKDPHIKSAAIAGMIQHGGLEGILSAASELKEMLDSNEWEWRLAGADVLRLVGIPGFYQPLIPLLEAEPDERVVAGAIRAAGNVRNVRLLPSLIAKLSNPKLSRVATDTLVKFGVDAAEALSFALSNEKEDMKCKLLIPRILGRTASQEGMNILMEFLEVENEELRMNIYQAIDRMVSLGADADFDTSRIEDLCEMEIKNYFQQVIMTQELGGRLEPMLLGDVLTQQRTKVRERVLHLLSILYPSGGIESVAVAFRSAYANTRANALELLDNLLHGKLKQGLLAMFEDSSIERASNSAAGLYPDLEHKEKDGWIKKLLEDQNPWLVACTLQHISHSSEAKHKYVKTIMALGEVSDHLVRETTLSVLKECLDEETYHNFVTPFLDDSHPIVMEFAKSQFEVL